MSNKPIDIQEFLRILGVGDMAFVQKVVVTVEPETFVTVDITKILADTTTTVQYELRKVEPNE